MTPVVIGHAFITLTSVMLELGSQWCRARFIVVRGPRTKDRGDKLI